MTITAHARAAYVNASVGTADPRRLLVMLCDRLALDVRRGLAALERGELPEAHHQLVHAQEIVLELRRSLRPEGFGGGEQLAAVYDHLHRELVRANVTKDAVVTGHCLELATSIAQTWHEAAAAGPVAPVAAS